VGPDFEIAFLTAEYVSDCDCQAGDGDWGAPHIHGELLKLGIDVGQTTGRTERPSPLTLGDSLT
jgi:hypothetical protein